MAKLTLIVDSGQAEQALQTFVKTTEGVTVASDRAVSSLGSVTRALAGIGLAYKTYDLARQALQISDAADRASQLFSAAFDGMTAQANRWANSVSTSMKAGATEVKQGAANFELMFQNMGFTNTAASQMTQDLTTLALKLEQVGRAAPGQAFGQLQSGLMGNVRTLRELGVTVNATMLQQYAVSKGWIDEGQKLSETGRVYTTYQMILDQTAKATAGVGDASQRYGEQTRELGVNIANIKEAIGSGLKPVVVEALSSINAWLADNTSKVKRWASDFKEGVGIVQGAWAGLTQPSQADLQKLWGTLSPNMQKAVGQAYESEKGEPAGYQTITAPGVMGGGAASVWQPISDPDYLRKLIGSYTHAWYGVSSPERAAAEQAAQTKWTATTGASASAAAPAAMTSAPAAGVPPSSITFADTTEADKLLKNLQQQREQLGMCNLEREEAKALETAGIENTGKLTDKTKALAGEITKEVDLLHRAKQEADATQMLQDLASERDLLFKTDQERQVAVALKKLDLTATDELAGKITQEIDALNKARTLKSVADDTGSAFDRAFVDIASGAAKASQAVQALGMDIERSLLHNLIGKPLGDSISTGIMSLFHGPTTTPAGDANPALASVAHSGSLIGYDWSPARAVSPLLFAHAPRYHTGLFPGEQPAILQNGETVLPAGSRPNITVNIANHSSAPVKASVPNIKIDLRRMVVGILLEDQQTNGPVTRGFKQ